jgi:hypothetical protein
VRDAALRELTGDWRLQTVPSGFVSTPLNDRGIFIYNIKLIVSTPLNNGIQL